MEGWPKLELMGLGSLTGINFNKENKAPDDESDEEAVARPTAPEEGAARRLREEESTKKYKSVQDKLSAVLGKVLKLHKATRADKDGAPVEDAQSFLSSLKDILPPEPSATSEQGELDAWLEVGRQLDSVSAPSSDVQAEQLIDKSIETLRALSAYISQVNKGFMKHAQLADKEIKDEL
jgi:hypothetical protein